MIQIVNWVQIVLAFFLNKLKAKINTNCTSLYRSKDGTEENSCPQSWTFKECHMFLGCDSPSPTTNNWQNEIQMIYALLRILGGMIQISTNCMVVGNVQNNTKHT